MIGNIIAEGKSFADNIGYNLSGKKDEPNPDKCAWFETRNLITDDLDAAGRIMQASAASSRTDKPVLHFSLDWHPDETDALDRQTVTDAADRVLDKLDLGEHQAIYFWHVDADHPHMHVVVNRVADTPPPSPAWDLWKSKERLECACVETAQEMNLMQVPGKHNQLGLYQELDGNTWQERDAYRQAERQEDGQPTVWDKADLADIRDQVSDHFRETESWLDLEQRLATEGLELHAKGQGLIVTDGSHYAKMSSLGKDIRLRGDTGLEQRFGQSWSDYIAQTDVSQRPCIRKSGLDKRLRTLEHTVDYGLSWDMPTQTALSRCDLRLQRLALHLDALHQFESSGSLRQTAANLGQARKDLNRQEWLRDKAQALIAFHQNKYQELLTNVFRTPHLARRRLRQIQNQRDLRAVLTLLTKKTNWQTWLDHLLRSNRRDRHSAGSKRREQQCGMVQLLERRLFYRSQKLREAEARLADRERGITQAKAALRTAEADHTRQQRTYHNLNSDKQTAVHAVSERLVFQSPLPKPVKTSFLDLIHKQPSDHTRKRSSDRSRRQTHERDPTDDL